MMANVRAEVLVLREKASFSYSLWRSFVDWDFVEFQSDTV